MVLEEFKKLVSDKSRKIELYDEIARISKEAISNIGEADLDLNAKWSKDEFKKRIKFYEESIQEVCTVQILLSFWGEEIDSKSIILPYPILSDYWVSKSGNNVWLGLQWYNNLLLLYYSGVASIASGNYGNFYSITQKNIPNPKKPNSNTTILQATLNICDNIKDLFQIISGEKKHHVPRSEYLFKLIKPRFEELLYLGSDYESYFDKFELILALEYAHQTSPDSPDYARGPIGRFGYQIRPNKNPLSELIDEAKEMEENWPPIVAGFFGGNFDRVNKISQLLEERVKKLFW